MNFSKRWKLFRCIAAVFAVFWLWATTAVAQAPEHRVYYVYRNVQSELVEYTEYLEDSLGILTIEQVSSPEFDNKFRPIPADKGNNATFGHTNSVFWTRARLATQDDTDIPVISVFVHNDYARYYVPNRLGEWDSVNSGRYLHPDSTGEFWPWGMTTIRVGREPVTVYMRVWAKTIIGSVSLQSHIWGDKSLWQEEARQQTIVNFMYVGILLALLLYNLFIAISTGEPLYWRYVFYVASFFGWQFFSFGLDRALLSFTIVPFASVFGGVLGSIAFWLGWRFISLFLESKSEFPAFHRVVTIGVGIAAISILITTFITVESAVMFANSITVIVGLLLLWSAGFVALRRRVRSAKYFLFAFSWVLLAVFIFFLEGIEIKWAHDVMLFINANMVGSALEMLLLSFAVADKMNAVKEDKARLEIENERERSRRELAEHEQKQEHLRNIELASLNTEIQQQAAQIQLANSELAEKNIELKSAYNTLHENQLQLIQSEKMAALGQLVAGIAHEINTPLGAIKASISNISNAIEDTLAELPALLRVLNDDELHLFFGLIAQSATAQQGLSAREARAQRRMLEKELSALNIAESDYIADLLVDSGIMMIDHRFIELWHRSDAKVVARCMYHLAMQRRYSETIAIGIERASKIVFALKTYSHQEHTGMKVRTNIGESIEIVLTLYQNMLKQGIEVERRYAEEIYLDCYADELSQVWTNIIHNAVQAMVGSGKLSISLVRKEEGIEIRFTDTGGGIPEEVSTDIRAIFHDEGFG